MTGERRYRIDMGRSEREIVCPEYTTGETDGTAVDNAYIVLPWYFLHRRKYPVQIYIFAINLYSKNPKIGQRAVAAATRKEFGLSGFSHSTVCRTFKTLGLSVSKAAEMTPTAQPADKNNAIQDKQGRFPSVTDTASRRAAMSEFIRDMAGGSGTDDILGISRTIVSKWYDKHRRLLI